MYNGAIVTLVGNLGDDPEMRYTPTGKAVATFSMAVVVRRKDGDSWSDVNTTWYRVNAWGNVGEHIAESLKRGNRVIVTGTLMARPWEDKEGNSRQSWEVTADTVGADLAYATVQIKRANRESPIPEDPWNRAGDQEPVSAAK